MSVRRRRSGKTDRLQPKYQRGEGVDPRSLPIRTSQKSHCRSIALRAAFLSEGALKVFSRRNPSKLGYERARLPTECRRVETYFRTVLAPYGKLADEHWRYLTEHSVRWDDASRGYVLLCDPSIAKGFRLPWFQSLNLWGY